MCKFKFVHAIVATIALIALTTPLSAGVVTSGYVQTFHATYSGAFNLVGPGFAADGAFDLGNFPAVGCNPCAPGALVDISGFVIGNDFRSGSATIGSKNFPYLMWGDFYSQSPSSFQIFGPRILLGTNPGTYYGTFSFGGWLCGTDGNSGECIVELPLGGAGRVSMDVSSGVGALWVDQVTYTFLTPEPGTLALLGSGVFGVWTVIRRRFVS